MPTKTTAQLEAEQRHHQTRAHTLRGKAIAAFKNARHYSRAAKRNRKEAHQLADRIATRKGKTGHVAAVMWALKQVGTAEQPAGSNKGPKITQWQVDSGYTWVPGAAAGVPWCQCFANAAAVAGGAPQLKTGYTPAVLAGTGDFKRIPESQAEAGDMVFFKWPGVSNDSCDHVGILTAPARSTGSVVTTVEGNTSPGTAGSQNNGGGVYHRSGATARPKSLVAGYVRVPYPKA